MKIYNYEINTGRYIGEGEADESPLEPGVFHLPALATTVEPLPPQTGKTVNFENGAWVYKDIPVAAEQTYAQLRAREYPSSADYLDGVVKGDQAQIDAYIAACMAVKAKYPKPEGQ
jgi:hypothetical protein